MSSQNKKVANRVKISSSERKQSKRLRHSNILKYPATPPTNNPAKQGIRNAVLFRKITFANIIRGS